MANKKAFYYFEVAIPASVREAHEGQNTFGLMRTLLEAHIAETDSKHSKIVREFVFADSKSHSNNSGDAASIEFINARHLHQYKTIIAEFRAWANENHGIEWSNEIYNEFPYDVASEETVNEEDLRVAYEVENKDFFFVKHPTARGF